MGGGQFSQKACNPASPNAAALCYCAYNIHAVPINGTLMSCLGEDQLPPGIYTMTYTQPGYNTPITSMPYMPYLPPSSSTMYTSSSIYSLIVNGFNIPTLRSNDEITVIPPFILSTWSPWAVLTALVAISLYDTLHHGAQWSEAEKRPQNRCFIACQSGSGQQQIRQ